MPVTSDIDESDSDRSMLNCKHLGRGAISQDYHDVAALTAALTGVPAVVVMLADQERWSSIAQVGVACDGWWTDTRLYSGRSWMVTDVGSDPRINLPTAEIRVEGFLAGAGMSLRLGKERHLVGMFCILDHQVRTWPDATLSYLEKFARQVESLLERDLAEAALATRSTEADQDRLLGKITAQVSGMVYRFLLRADGTACFPYSSEGIRDVYGVSPESAAMSAQEVIDRLHPEDKDHVMASIGESAAQGTRWQCVYRYLHPDGVTRWLKGQAMPERLPDGSVMWHGFITDIGERKILDQRVQASEALATTALREARMYQTIIDQHSITTITDDRGVITAVNDAFCAISGYAREELLGQDHRVVTSGHHPKVFWEYLWATLLAGKSWREEICNRAKDGSIYWVDSFITPFHDAESL